MFTVKTRFCPSPTGLMHIGNARVALFNALYAIKYNGSFLLRIEDTDLERSEEKYIIQLCDDLTWLELDWQEGYAKNNNGNNSDSYKQSQRKDIYEKYLEILKKDNKIYPCFCSSETLETSRKIQLKMGQPPRYDGTCRNLVAVDLTKKHTIRFKVTEGEIVFDDIVKKKQVFNNEHIGDFIIKRSTGAIGFFFVNAIDDALMKVTHAIRGEDHLTNTPRQIMMLNALKLTPPTYAHIPLTLGSDGKPLSKRNGSVSIKDLRDKGYFAIAIQNLLARLGHSYTSNELMTINELGQNFDEKRISNAPAKFDIQQLNFWQSLAVHKKTDKELLLWVKNEIADLVPQDEQLNFVMAIRDNILFPNDAKQLALSLLTNTTITAEELAKTTNTPKIFFIFLLEAIEKSLKYSELLDLVKGKTGLKGKELFQPIRIALTTISHGPEMKKVYPLIKKEILLERLKLFLQKEG